MRIVLDLPPRELNPNSRTHWSKKAKAVKYYRQLAFIAARNAENRGRGWDRAEVVTVFYLPDRRRRDPDNLMASLKAAWDGIVEAGVLTDDNQLIIFPPVIAFDSERPRVEIEMREAA